MGKGGRVACILTPWLLTIASFVCIAFIEMSGWNKGVLPGYYFMKVNFTDMDVSGASGLANTTTLTAALKEVQGELANIYEIHLWNYCTSESRNGTIDFCSGRTAGFTFDFIDTWHLNETSAASDTTSNDNSNNVITSTENNIKDKTEQLENNLLGDTARKALQAYRSVGKAGFYLFAVSFWGTLATIVAGILAICSRWGSLLTWILAFASSVVNLAAVAIMTALYIALVEGFKGVFDEYNIHVNIGTSALAVSWLSVAFSWAATLFWLFSICCCSGSSNPHHRSQKGGLWKSEAKGMGYGDYGRRSMPVSSTGGYQRVSSPFLGHAENEHGDRVPLNDYPQQPGHAQPGGAYEPFRHS